MVAPARGSQAPSVPGKDRRVAGCRPAAGGAAPPEGPLGGTPALKSAPHPPHCRFRGTPPQMHPHDEVCWTFRARGQREPLDKCLCPCQLPPGLLMNAPPPTQPKPGPLGRRTPTSGIHRAQLTCTHLVPLRVGFMAPPFLGHSRHFGCTPRAQVLHSQLPSGTLRIP